MKYVKPQLELLEIKNVDVITASLGNGGDSEEDKTPGVGFQEAAEGGN